MFPLLIRSLFVKWPVVLTAQHQGEGKPRNETCKSEKALWNPLPALKQHSSKPSPAVGLTC